MTPTNTIRKNLIYVLLLTALTMTGCWGGQQPKAYASQLTSSDSMSIQMGNYTLMKYHSDRLGFDINYPSFLYRQELPDDAGMQELGDQQRHAAPGHNHPALLSRARRSHGTPQRMGPRLPNHPVSIMLR